MVLPVDEQRHDDGDDQTHDHSDDDTYVQCHIICTGGSWVERTRERERFDYERVLKALCGKVYLDM